MAHTALIPNRNIFTLFTFGITTNSSAFGKAMFAINKFKYGPLQVLKNPLEGMENITKPSSWRWFSLMDDALGGRLAGTASILQLSPSNEDEDTEAALPQLILSDIRGGYSEHSTVETGSLGAAGTLEEVVEPSGLEPSVEHVPDEGDAMEAQPAALYATILPDCTTESKETPSSSRTMVAEVAEVAEVDRKLVELRREKQALEREQAEFDRELISLERDRELLNRDMAKLEQDRAALDLDRAAVERDKAAVERDRMLLDRDRAIIDRDRAFLERDRVFLERAREDLERERALLSRLRAGLDESQAETPSDRDVIVQSRFSQSLMAAQLDPDQLQTRQRLVFLLQKLVEKL